MAAETFLTLDPGPFTSIQDLGRFGYQALGVPVSGALDNYAAQAANLLAGNEPGQAVLEMTVRGSSLAVIKPTRVALTGALAQVRLNSRDKAVWSAFNVEPGDILRIGQVSQGCRIYMAVSGGFDVPLVMGSRSTYPQASLGGLEGRILSKGDLLPTGTYNSFPTLDTVPEAFIPELEQKIVLRCVPGPQTELFQDQGNSLYNCVYTVTQRADRRGIRLEGPQIAHCNESFGSIISEPVLPGNIQVPGDGQPIILLREQTVGGYPKIATVVSSDLSLLGQVVPGMQVVFEAVDVQRAKEIRSRSEQTLLALAKTLRSSA